jgi:hypothetical protein
MRCKWFTPVLCLMFLAAPAVSQSYWANAGTNQLSLEMVHPDMSSFGGVGWTTSSLTFFGSGSFGIRDNLALNFELPFARAQLDVDGAESSSSIGNPYVGAEWGLPTYGLVLTGGVRLPLTKDDDEDAFLSQVYGLFSTVDRMEAFLPNTTTLQASARLTRELAPGIFAAARLGFNGLVYSDTEEGDDSSDLFTLYGAQGWYETGALRLGGGLLGRMILTESDAEDKSMHEAGVWLDYAMGPVRTGISIRVPLDDPMSDVMDYAVGLTVAYRLPR